MPGVHYKTVQSRVPMARVLELLGFVARGVSRRPTPRALSGPLLAVVTEQVVLGGIWPGTCVAASICGFAGNQIQLWAALNKMTVYEAAFGLVSQQAGRRGAVDKASGRQSTCEEAGASRTLPYGNRENTERAYSNNKRN